MPQDGTRALAVAIALLLAAACGREPSEELLAMEITEASFSNPQILAGGVAMGGMVVYADMSVIDSEGEPHSYPIALSGMDLGGVGIWSNQTDIGQSLDIGGMSMDLPESVTPDDGGAAGPVTLGHLFGEYSGMGFGLHAIIGGGIFTFSNDVGVNILVGAFTPGIGINWGMCPEMLLQLR